MQSFGSIFFITYNVDVDGAASVEWVGSAIIWFLILMSVANVALIVTLALRSRRTGILPDAFADRVRELAANGRSDEAASLASAEASDFSRMLTAGVQRRGEGVPAMRRAVEQASESLVITRFRSIEALNVFGQIAPLIGLFGTVYGVIMKFQSIAVTGGRTDPALLAGGIGTALVATFWGLFIAIPALWAYANIRNKVDAIDTEATRRVEELIPAFARGPGAHAAPGPQGARALVPAPGAAPDPVPGSAP